MSHDDFQPPDAPTSEQEHEARELLTSNPVLLRTHGVGLWGCAAPIPQAPHVCTGAALIYAAEIDRLTARVAELEGHSSIHWRLIDLDRIKQLEAERDRLRAALTRNPEDDLYSDAMDGAVSMYHSVRHGAMRNAEKSGEAGDGELIVRRALAAGFKAYLEEIRRADETSEHPAGNK